MSHHDRSASRTSSHGPARPGAIATSGRGERFVAGFLLIAVFSALAAAVLGVSRARAAAPTVAASPATAQDGMTHPGPDVSLVVDQGPVRASVTDGTADRFNAGGGERCDALTAEGLRVTFADAEASAFCLVEQQDAGALYVQLLNVTDAATFAARKTQTAGALASVGVDVCRVTLWWVRRDAVRARVPVTEQYASPNPCAPRITAHDSAAAWWSDFTSRTVASALEQAEREYGVRPSMPLAVHLHGSRDAYVRQVTAGQPSEDTRARLAETEGVTARGTIEGAWIALDTSRFSPAWPERAAFVIRHEVAHYVQTVSAGCACAFPVWFAEGLADVSAAAALGPITTRHLAARSAEQMGQTTPLRELGDYTSTGTVAAVYDRGYAAVSYLAERWGAGVAGELLRRNRNGDTATFTRALTELTGMSLDDLDRAVSRWLLSATPEGTAAGRMTPRFTAPYAIYDPAAGRVEGEGTVFGADTGQIDVVVTWDCAPGAHRVTARWYRPDGALFYEETTGGDDVRCSLVTRSRLNLTTPGRTGGVATATPGRWRVEISADGRPAVAMDVVIGG
jgi:hypothetical protein